MQSSVEAARQQWEDGNRRLEAYSSDPYVYEPLLDQLDVATEELPHSSPSFRLIRRRDVHARPTGRGLHRIGQLDA